MRAQSGGGTYNPDRSYDTATWIDYKDWLERMGIQARYDTKMGMEVVYNDEYLMFTTKKALFEWILENVDA